MASLQGAKFIEADLEGAQFKSAFQSFVSDATVSRPCNLSAIKCLNSNLSEVLFEKTKLTDAEIQDCDLRHSQWQGVKLNKAIFKGTNQWQRLVFSEFEGKPCTARGTKFLNQNMAGATPDGLRLAGADVSGCDFSKSVL